MALFSYSYGQVLVLSEEKAAALKEVDPWWNIPWSVKWQRSCYRARDHVRRHGPLNAADGFPDMSTITLCRVCTSSSVHALM